MRQTCGLFIKIYVNEYDYRDGKEVNELQLSISWRGDTVYYVPFRDEQAPYHEPCKVLSVGILSMHEIPQIPKIERKESFR